MVIILAYHGVTEYDSSGVENSQNKHIPANLFEAQMRQLRETEQVLRLSEVTEAYERGEHVDGVVVTFDDGYQNNATVALPILERYGIFATFFLTTGLIGTDRMFWVDEVELAVDQSRREAVDLSACGLGRLPLGSPEEKRTAIATIKAYFKRIDDEVRKEGLEELKRQLPIRLDEALSPNYRTLRWEDVQAMARSPLLDFGAHSVDHAILTRLSLADAALQMREAKCALEERLGAPITMFAYPNGGEEDYNEELMRLLRQEGFRCACTTVPGINEPSVSLFALRRHMVGFCDAPFPLVDAAQI